MLNHTGGEKIKAIYRVATARGSTDSLQACFAYLPALQFLPAGDLLKADVLMIDARAHLDVGLQGNDSITGLLEASGSMPIVVVVGEHCAGDDYLNDLCGKVDPQRVELLSELEITSNIPLMRVGLLMRRNSAKQEADVLRKNAHSVLQSVMQYSNDWMVVKDLDHRFLLVSRLFCEAYGKSAAEIIGKNDLEIGTSRDLVLGKPDTDWKGYWELDEQVTQAGKPVVLQPLVLKENEERVIREYTDKVPLTDKSGNVFGLLVCVSELAVGAGQSGSQSGKGIRTWERRKNLAELPALLELNNERKKAEALRQKSERAVVAKNRFIAAASHDLRQPLHAIGLYIQVLEARVDGEVQELVEQIKRCVVSLNELLTSLLDISKLDANQVAAEYQNFLIDGYLNSLVEECANIARDKSIKLSCITDHSAVFSDPILLRRVVRNILLNAINHTNGGKVSIRAQRLGSCVNLRVSDTGIGIPLDKQEMIFEEFTKLTTSDNTTSNGLGLGLSIVKHLCLLLDIQLKLTSTPDVGTQISLMIPLGKKTERVNDAPDDNSRKKPAVHHTMVGSPQQEIAKRDQLIVVIDDETVVCEAVDILLTGFGYSVIAATTAEEAIELLRENNLIPAAMVVDFRLEQGVTGTDVVKQINETFEISAPALIVTGDTSELGLKEIARSGLVYLHKPVAADVLLERLGSMLGETQSQQG